MNLVTLLLVGAVAAFVAWPFFATWGEGSGEQQVALLEKKKIEAYAAIKEAEFDLRMDKMSEDDFRVLEGRYRRQALAAIAAIERARGKTRRAEPPAGSRGSAAALCPSCHSAVIDGASFCAACGTALSAVAAS